MFVVEKTKADCCLQKEHIKDGGALAPVAKASRSKRGVCFPLWGSEVPAVVNPVGSATRETRWLVLVSWELRVALWRTVKTQG